MKGLPQYIIHEGTGTIMPAEECVVVNCDWEFEDMETNVDYLVRSRGFMPTLKPKVRGLCNRCGILEDTEEWIEEHFACDVCDVDRCIGDVKVLNITDRNAQYPNGVLLRRLLVCPKCYSHHSNLTVEVSDDQR